MKGKTTKRTLLLGAAALGLTAASLGTAGGNAFAAKPASAKSGGTLTATVPDLISLDPLSTDSNDIAVETIAPQVFNSLIYNDKGKFKPDLASSWATSANGLTWTFKLNPKARFANGKQVTSEDVEASLKELISAAGPDASLFATVVRMTTPSRSIFRVSTRVPLGTMLFDLSLLYVVPANEVANSGYWSKPFGSGAFKVVSYQPGTQVVLERNPRYWGAPAHLAKVVLSVIPEEAGQVTALQTGTVQLLTGLSSSEVPEVRAIRGARVAVSKNSLRVLSIWFNNKQAPFNNKDVRQAMWYSVDWNAIVKSLYGSTAAVAQDAIPSGTFGFRAQKNAYAYNPQIARQLLAKAGMAQGFTTSLMFYPENAPGLQLLLQAAASYWANVGIKVTLDSVADAVFTSQLLALNWSITAVGNTSTTGDADQILGRLYVSSADRLGFANSSYDQLVSAAASTTDQTQRAKYYAQAGAILWNDAVGIWPLQFKAVYGVSSRVKGFVPSAKGIPDYSALWLSNP